MKVSLVIAAISMFVYDRRQVLSMFYSNAPGRIHETNTFRSHEIKFADRIRNCEDVLLLEDRGLAVIGCDPGRERHNTVMGLFAPGPTLSATLYLFDYKHAILPDSDSLREIELANFLGSEDFHTLGLAYDAATTTLFAVSHAKAGPRIEIFRLDVDTAVATHLNTVRHPLLHAPNAIALVDNKNFYVTNDHYFPASVSKLLSNLETYLGVASGTIVRVRLQGSNLGEVQSAKVVARVPFANGIEVMNSSTVAVASTSRGAVYLYDSLKPDKLKYKSQIRVPFMPDNLYLSDGKLMIAGHPHPPSLTRYAGTRYICNDPVELFQAAEKLKAYCETGMATSSVAEWNEGGGLRVLYSSTEYPTSATAAKDARRGVGIVAGLYAKGILVWRE